MFCLLHSFYACQCRPLPQTSPTAGGSGAVPIPLTIAAATFSVTVPTSLPINVDADGNVTTATNLKIVNNGHGAVKVTNMSVKGIEDWQIISYDNANMVSEKVNAHKIAMAINGDKTTADDTITFSSTNFPKLDGANATNSDELTITYNAKVPAQAATLDNVNKKNNMKKLMAFAIFGTLLLASCAQKGGKREEFKDNHSVEEKRNAGVDSAAFKMKRKRRFARCTIQIKKCVD